MDLKKIFSESKENKKVALIKAYDLNTPTWEKSVLNLNYAFHNTETTILNKNEAIYNGRGNQSAIKLTEKLNIFSFHSIRYRKGQKHDHGNFLTEVEPIIDRINESFDSSKIYAGKLHLNLLGDGQSYDIHEDDHDVLSWQTNGKVEYRIHDSKNFDLYETYLLEPGDIIYMPSGLIHSIRVIEPRTTIIFQIHSIYDNSLDW